MPVLTTLEYQEQFTNATSVVVTHNLDREYVDISLIIDGEVCNDMISGIQPSLHDPTNEMIVTFTASITGRIQVFSIGTVSANSEDLTTRSLPPVGMTDTKAVIGVWAEKNGSLGKNNNQERTEKNDGLGKNNNQEWAFGNGANTPQGQGVVVPFDCELFAGWLCLGQGNAVVGIYRNGKSVFNVTSVGATSVQQVLNTVPVPIPFSAGDVVGFRTVTASDTSGPNTVGAWFRET